MADWRFMPREWDWCEARIKYTGDAFQILTLLEVPLTYCDELQIEPEDDKLLVEVYESVSIKWDKNMKNSQLNFFLFNNLDRLLACNTHMVTIKAWETKVRFSKLFNIICDIHIFFFFAGILFKNKIVRNENNSLN